MHPLENSTVERGSVKVISGRSKWAIAVHIVAIILATTMFIYIIYSLAPLYRNLIKEREWVAILYLTLACLIIPPYWSSVTYRTLLLLILPFSSKLKCQTFKVLDSKFLMPVSIVIAIRNEPASIVIPLLKSLLKLDYPDYEIVITDNSDILDDRNKINRDFLDIFEFAKTHKTRNFRFVRRDCGARSYEFPELSRMLHPRLKDARVKGNLIGGKAGNLNAALNSANERYKWFLILDSDSLLPDRTLCQMVSIALQVERTHQSVGFIQGVLSSANPNESSLSNTLSVIDEIYYDNYSRLKSTFGVVSNWGHGVLVSRKAWEATGGFPCEISEDLAWANEVLLLGKFENHHALCHTFETKPVTWKALKIQRNRWAKGTTIQMRKQLFPLWKSDKLLWYEKMDLTYDMTRYIFTSIGCLLPFF